jgi:uncharacterized protein YbjQ (UPF0145 family)
MTNPKDILVVTTSSVEGLKIKKYLKPVSSHIVAGTNFFSDLFAGFSDVFGGRSSTYQKQLSSLYNEAIEKIKYNAYEIGGNCIVGLSIDMDEVSGKGKSMFMLTAIGTAVIIEKDEKINIQTHKQEKLESIGIESLNNLRKQKKIINDAQTNNLNYSDETWNFIISNQMHELYPHILSRHSEIILNFESMQDAFHKFHKNFMNFIDSLEDEQKLNILYDNIENETNDNIARYLSKIIKSLNLYDFDRNMKLLENPNLTKRKIGLRISTYDKIFYDKNDIENLIKIKNIISNFKERGTITTKKQLLSSKEKEVWDCECGNKSNDIGIHCSVCQKDIFGFYRNEIKPNEAIVQIEEKIGLIQESII